jgi:uncharacterized ferredoxin-like protein
MKGIDLVADLMAISANTAPKGKGKNYVKTKIVKGADLKRLGRAMEEYSKKVDKKDFARDGKNVQSSELVVLVGLKDARPVDLNCGGCGFQDCETFTGKAPSEVQFRGPSCAIRLLDMGIALGSAVKTAGIFNVDNRMMYTVGVVARHIQLVDWDVVIGIPLSVTGKNIFFDRPA